MNATGIITNIDTGKALGIESDGIKVEEQSLNNSTTGQIWKICYSNTSGYFTIESPASGKLLTAIAAFDLRVISM